MLASHRRKRHKKDRVKRTLIKDRNKVHKYNEETWIYFSLILIERFVGNFCLNHH